MPLPDERQAKALERIAISASHLLKVMEALNENLVAAFGFLKEQIEKDNERIAGYEIAADPNQMTIDEMRAASEKAEKEREDRSGYLTCGCTMLHCDTHLAELDRAKRAEREARPHEGSE
jgi:nucleoside-triphosphatase THEP1